MRNSRKINSAGAVASGGIFAAVSVVLIVLGSVIRTNTLFLLALASFLQGILVRKYGIVTAVCSAFAAAAAGFLMSPEKLYCLTFAGFSVYVIVAEYFRKKEAVRQQFWEIHGRDISAEEDFRKTPGRDAAAETDFSESAGRDTITETGFRRRIEGNAAAEEDFRSDAGFDDSSEYMRKVKREKLLEWTVKFIVFNALFALAMAAVGYITGFSEIIQGTFLKNVRNKALAAFIVIIIGEAAWICFDRIYVYFQDRIVSRYMKKFLQS